MAKRRLERKANINIAAIIDGFTMTKRRIDINIAITASELTKKKVDIKVIVTVNKTVIVNAYKPARNARKPYANLKVTTVINLITTTNKATSNAKKMYINVTANSNGNNTR